MSEQPSTTKLARASRWLGRWALRASATGLLAATGLLVADRLNPPDLSRYHARSAEVLDADGRLLRAFTTADDKWRLATTVADVDPLYLAMLKAYEDRRFDLHPGVDSFAVLRASGLLAANGRIVSGASTLSMQAARLLEHDRPEWRSWRAKARQALRAIQLEWRYSKAEVLAIYLTLTPMGGNLEGVRAASFAYFGKEPKRLTPAEAALLVALPQSPRRRQPDRFPLAARQARDVVLDRALEAGLIDAAASARGRANAVSPVRLAMPFTAPHLAQHLVAGARGLRTIGTTIRREIQDSVARLAAAERHRFGDGGDIAIVVVDNRRNTVVAWHGGDFAGRHGQVDLVRARRSPGSTLKPFIYGLAIEDGIAHPETLVDDSPTRFGDWLPRNFDRGHQGVVTLRRALQQSLNVPAVATLDRVGPKRLMALFRAAGTSPALPRQDEGSSLAIALGGIGFSPLELASLYSALANGGWAKPPRVLASAASADPVRLLGPGAVWHVTDMLANAPLPEGWTSAARNFDGKRVGDRGLAFKTGTSYGFRDAWAAGYSPNFTVVVWTGRTDGTPRPGQYGRDTALPILLKAFDRLPSEPAVNRPPPPDALIAARTADLPPVLRALLPPSQRLAVATRAERPTAHASLARPPQILYPPANAVIDIGRNGEADAIPLRAEGGSGQLRWLIDGAPLPLDRFRREPLWHPAGAGSARITVVDAEGRSATATVRISTGR